MAGLEVRVRISRARAWTSAMEQTKQPAPWSISAYQADELSLNSHAIGAIEARFVCRICSLQCDRVAPPTQPLQGRFLIVDQRHDDLACVGHISFLNDDCI